MMPLQRRHMVGLGRGKQHSIDACTKQQAQRTTPAETERLEDSPQRQSLIGEGLLAGVERAQHVDKNNLAIDIAGEVHEKWLDDSPLVGLEARLHDGAEASRPRACSDWERNGAKPQH